jgi:hypothetical protein
MKVTFELKQGVDFFSTEELIEMGNCVREEYLTNINPYQHINRKGNLINIRGDRIALWNDFFFVVMQKLLELEESKEIKLVSYETSKVGLRWSDV